MSEKKMVTNEHYKEIYVSNLEDLKKLVSLLEENPNVEIVGGVDIEYVTITHVLETDIEFRNRLRREKDQEILDAKLAKAFEQQEFAKYQELKKKFECK